MANANASSDAATPPTALRWYSKVFSRRLDLIGDYVGNNFFLIDGNSLLLHCLSDEHIDFNQGFQLLHAAWAVERFLKDLIRRRCHFHIAFFTQYRELCVPSFVSDETQREKFLLARAAIIRHLRANLPQAQPEVSVKVFESVFADEFTNYLRDVEFFFVLAHDGAFPEALRTRYLLRNNLDASQDKVDDEENHREQQTKTAFRQIIHWFMSGGMSVALINGISFQDTKVMSNVLEHRNVESGVPLTIDFQNDSIDEPRPNYLKRSFWEKMNGERNAKLSERQYISLLVLSALLHGEVISSEFADAFLRHSALISQLHLSERFVEAEGLDEETGDMLQEFCEEASLVLSSDAWANNMSDWKCICDVSDLVDGRLLAMCTRNKRVGRNESYDALVEAMAATGSEVVGNAETSEESDDTNSQITPSQTNGTSYAVLPFSNNVIDSHLEPIKLSIDRSGEIPPAITSQIFREATHWHNSKRPMDPKIREDQIASSAKQMKKVLRRNQFFMAEMTTYAASLTNSVGRALEPEIITTGAKPEKKESENTKGKPAPKANQNPKGGKKGAPSRKEAMLAQIAKDKSRKDEASADTVVASWRVACDNLEKEPTAMARFQKAKQYLVALPESKKNVLEAEIRLYLLHNRLTVWVQFCKSNKKEENQHIAAGVYESLLSLSQLRRPVTKTITLCLEKTIKELSLPKVPLPTPTENDRKLAFKFFLSNTSGVSLTIPTDPITFQLSYCGPYLDRSMDSAPDPRVPFEPDAWQRKVLDEIDARRSLLVVAPTSAGKTFISFYAMQQVLASNDDDVLVYVAPTKALVNQIAAEVQGRFSKTYKYGGNSVWGIHTRDYRINNPNGCQILVTVPHILQIMLLDPSNAGSWAKRVKWIIFDEVHCIGQAEDGQVWEQLLLMAPCPIIALSATIGNPEEFSDWLNSTQKAVGNTLTMVRHPHRYSDLRKFKYTPVASTEFQGLPESRAFARLGLDDEAFNFLHPVTSLINRSRGIPDDFSLEAADCLTLWQTLSKYQSANYPVDKSLDPKSALPPIVKKIDIIKWEKSLKEVLKLWMSDPDSPFEDVVKELGKSVTKSHFSLDNSKALAQKKDVDAGEDDDEEKEPEDTFDAESILPMLVRLHEQDALPGIIFNYDRGLCEKICSTLLEQLETAETKWKETSPKWKSDLKKWEEYKAVMAKANKRNPPKLSKKKGNDEDGLTKEDIARDGANNEANPWASFDPERPVDRFHFADNKKLTREELDVYERELIRRDVPEWLLRGLRRGIGVHHAGMNRKYRQVCEMLFRRGYLRVVVATGTLALGINMPCKTVVFSGDSVFLTALNYRQAAGRAGRRGFDMLGNVVFHGVSESKIHRLVSSRLPDINGHFPITTTLVLRLFTLLNGSNQAPVAIRAVNALLSQPRLYLGGEESKLTVLHFLRFSIEYLRKEYLLGPKGEPVNLAGVVSHLYYAESSSFAFHALVKEGFFHRLCNNFDTQREAVLNEMILVMAHLFGRQSCKYADREYIENVVKRSPSIVFLPPMPEDASEILQKHNQSTLGVYKGYVKTFAEQHLDEPEDVLPLTNMGIKGDSSMKSSNLRRRAPPIVRSPFVALSGYTDDDIDSIHDLCTTVRSGVFLEEAIVPYVGVYNDKSDMPLNAYLYDFYNHGDVKALAVANRIRRGDVWFVLNDFSMVLATIVTSLSNFMNLSAESELDVRGEGEGVEEAQEDRLLPDDSGYETGSTISAASRGPAARSVLPVQVKKKKKVADSWDDDADEEDLQAEAAAKAEKVEAELRALEEKPAWEEGQGLLNVLKAFKALKEEFDTKFRAMWA